MAQLKFYLDRRKKTKDGYPLKINVSHLGSSALISLGIFLEKDQWNDTTEQIVAHPQRAILNNFVSLAMANGRAFVLESTMDGTLKNYGSAVALRNALAPIILPGERQTESNSVVDYFETFIATQPLTKRTKQNYQLTLNKIRQHDKRAENLTFEDLTAKWLDDFNSSMHAQNLKTNSRSVHLRNIRAVVNHAIRSGVTDVYGFQRFKIKSERTQSRALRPQTFRAIYFTPQQVLERSGVDIKYLDFFRLSFLLCGISPTDLLHLQPMDKDGYINYKRAKTGVITSTKIEPEALEIIDKYRGEKHLLRFIEETSAESFARCTNKALQLIGTEWINGTKRIGHPLYPNLTLYYTRHTWASIAGELEVPEIIINTAQGRVNTSVASIYVRVTQSKVDEINRRVIDYVLGAE